MKLVLWSLLLCTLLLLAFPAGEAKHHRHHHHRRHHKDDDDRKPSPPPPQQLVVDAYGNCYTQDRRLQGRCVRFPNCPTAIRGWQQYHIPPLSCYYTMYENFVCCPDGQLATPPLAPLLPTLASELPLQSPPPTNLYPYSPYASQLPAFSDRHGQPKRVSDEECEDIYDVESDREKREVSPPNKDEVTTPIAKDPDAEAQEVGHEAIVKERQSSTAAVGGVRTVPEEFPYMCALGWRPKQKRRSTSYNCGCVLIARKYALTAAHCASIGGDSPSVVRLGGVDLDEEHAQVINIKRITPHPNYTAEAAYDDIAIVKLTKSTDERPACLWTGGGEALPQSPLIGLGYGQTAFAGPSSNELLKVFLSPVSHEECSRSYKAEAKISNGLNAGHLCAGDPQGKMDTCQGDSGGPLLVQAHGRDFVVGLTSFGVGCASGSPSVYTRIAHYLDWIEDNVWN